MTKTREINEPLAKAFFFYCLQDSKETEQRDLQEFVTSCILGQRNLPDELAIFYTYLDHMEIIGRHALYGERGIIEANGDRPKKFLVAGAEQLTGKRIDSFLDIDFKCRFLYEKGRFFKTFKYNDSLGYPVFKIVSRLKIEVYD